MFKKISVPKLLAFGALFGGLFLVLAYMGQTPAPVGTVDTQAEEQPPATQAPAQDTAKAPPKPERPRVVDPAGPFGRYLAGKHAETVGETSSALDFYRAASRDQDLATTDLYSRMYVLGLAEGDLDQAINALDATERKGGHAPLSKLTRAVHAMSLGDFDAVEALLGDEKTGVSRLLGPTLIAWARVAKGDFPGAIKALDKMKDDAKVEPMRLLHTGLIHDLSGNAQKAGAHFKALHDLSGLSLRSVQLMGANLERQGKFKQAQALYQNFNMVAEGELIFAEAKRRMDTGQVPALDVDTAKKGAADALYGVSTVLLAQGSWDVAMALANMSLSLRPDFPAATLIKAAALEHNKRLAEANAIYGKIPATDPLSWTARLHMADNLDRMGQTDDAVTLLRDLAKAHPTRSRPLTDLGEMLRRHERFAEAIDAYDQALALSGATQPEHWRIYYSRGIAFEQTKQWPKAEADFLKALALQPDQPMVLNYLGYSWIDQGQNLKRALDMIRKAVNLRPRDGYIVDSLGWGQYRIGDFKGAVKSLERATMLLPADPLVNDHLGDALWQVGRTREARFQWQRALDLEPKADVAKALHEKLQSGLPAVPPKPAQ